MAEHAVRVRLPDFYDRISNRQIPSIDYTARQNDVLSARGFAFELRQIAAIIGKLGRKKTDRSCNKVPAPSHQSKAGVRCLPRSTKSRRNFNRFTAPTAVAPVSTINRARASGSGTPFSCKSDSFSGSPGKKICVTNLFIQLDPTIEK
jgi:hypothetical protein